MGSCDLMTAQQRFMNLIDDVNEDHLPMFAIWLDGKMAEYKVFGNMHRAEYSHGKLPPWVGLAISKQLAPYLTGPGQIPLIVNTSSKIATGPNVVPMKESLGMGPQLKTIKTEEQRNESNRKRKRRSQQPRKLIMEPESTTPQLNGMDEADDEELLISSSTQHTQEAPGKTNNSEDSILIANVQTMCDYLPPISPEQREQASAGAAESGSAEKPREDSDDCVIVRGERHNEEPKSKKRRNAQRRSAAGQREAAPLESGLAAEAHVTGEQMTPLPSVLAPLPVVFPPGPAIMQYHSFYQAAHAMSQASLDLSTKAVPMSMHSVPEVAGPRSNGSSTAPEDTPRDLSMYEGEADTSGEGGDGYGVGGKAAHSVPCCDCDKVFTKAADLKTHLLTAHNHHGFTEESGEEGKLFYSCRFCSKTFGETLEAFNHCTLEHLNDPFTCHFCAEQGKNVGFACREYLRQHINGMHGPPKYKCRWCGERFRWTSQLATHRKKCQLLDADADLRGKASPKE